MNLVIVRPTPTKPAVNNNIRGLTLPTIAPIEDIRPATGPSGPWTAAIEPAVSLKALESLLLPLEVLAVALSTFFKLELA